MRWLGSAAGRDHRWALVVALTAVVVFTGSGGKSYYPAPALIGLFAVLIGLPVLPVNADNALRPINPELAPGVQRAQRLPPMVQSTVADHSCDHRCMEVASINALAAEQLAKAMTVGSGRSSVTVYGRSGARLRQTLVALGAGQVMGEHKSPGDASVLCLQGRVLLRAGESQAELGPGGLVALPPQRHDLEALEPSVLLLTVALH